MMKPPFFVVGTQRSGTTLLYQILNSHPELFCVNECDSLYPYFQSDRPNLAGLLDLLCWRCDLEPSFWEKTPANSAVEMINLAFEAAAQRNGAGRWGIKDPQMTYFLDTLRRVYPEAQFLIIYRDPRAVCNSYLKTKTVANVFAGAHLWQQEIRLQREFLQANPTNTFLVQYEHLLDHFEESVQKICAFYGVASTQDMLKFYQQPSTAKIHQGNENITKPIQAQKKEEWRKYLTPKQIGVIQSVCGPLMEELGYEADSVHQEISAWQQRWFRLQERVMQEYWWQRRSRWYGIRRRIGLLSEAEKKQLAMK